MTCRDAERDQLIMTLRTHSDLPVLWPSSDRIADALLPVVDRIANERAAAELEAAARDFDPARRSWLIRRAAALRASNGAGVGT